MIKKRKKTKAAKAKILKTNIWLQPNEELFCQIYVSEDFFWNWVHSYIKANPWTDYDTAKVAACLFLKKPHINRRILDLLDINWFNDYTVDKALLSLILQDNEKNVKLWAIKEYNSLKARLEKSRQKALNDWDISTDVLWLTIQDYRTKSIEELNELKKNFL